MNFISFPFSLWDEAELIVSPTVSIELLNDVALPFDNSRAAASSALAAALEEHPFIASDVRDQLIALYFEHNKVKNQSSCFTVSLDWFLLNNII